MHWMHIRREAASDEKARRAPARHANVAVGASKSKKLSTVCDGFALFLIFHDWSSWCVLRTPGRITWIRQIFVLCCDENVLKLFTCYCSGCVVFVFAVRNIWHRLKCTFEWLMWWREERIWKLTQFESLHRDENVPLPTTQKCIRNDRTNRRIKCLRLLQYTCLSKQQQQQVNKSPYDILWTEKHRAEELEKSLYSLIRLASEPDGIPKLLEALPGAMQSLDALQSTSACSISGSLGGGGVTTGTVTISISEHAPPVNTPVTTAAGFATSATVVFLQYITIPYIQYILLLLGDMTCPQPSRPLKHTLWENKKSQNWIQFTWSDWRAY